jgi:hypothetical protein
VLDQELVEGICVPNREEPVAGDVEDALIALVPVGGVFLLGAVLTLGVGLVRTPRPA